MKEAGIFTEVLVVLAIGMIVASAVVSYLITKVVEFLRTRFKS